MEGVVIKMKHIKKKFIIYACIFIGQVLLTLFVSHITGVETTNTWLGALYANVFCLTIIVMLLDIAKSIKDSHSLMGCIIKFCYSLLIVILAIVNVVLIVSAFNR